MGLKKIISLSAIIVSFITTGFYNISFAEPFYFHPKLVSEIKTNVRNNKNI